MAGRCAGGAAGGDVPPPTGAAGADSEAWRRRAAAWDSDDSGPGGADRSHADLATDLRGGHGTDGLWLPAGPWGAGGRSGGAPGVVRRAHGGGGRGRVAVFRHDPARGVAEVGGAPDQRWEAAPVGEAVAQGA